MSERWVPLDVEDVDADPFEQFQRWFIEGVALMPERDAVALATSTAHGVPSVRMVLLRYHDHTSFGWYTNYDSRKGDDLSQNPRAALLWYCEPLGRQIRIEGTVAKMTAEESDAYFATRPRGSQIGAHASEQSEPLASREALEERVAGFEAAYAGRDVPRPDDWGGYRLTPHRFEFWQHRDSRLHDRVVYVPHAGAWRRERLAP